MTCRGGGLVRGDGADNDRAEEERSLHGHDGHMEDTRWMVRSMSCSTRVTKEYLQEAALSCVWMEG